MGISLSVFAKLTVKVAVLCCFCRSVENIQVSEFERARGTLPELLFSRNPELVRSAFEITAGAISNDDYQQELCEDVQERYQTIYEVLRAENERKNMFCIAIHFFL